jgi:hypothetical protein
VKGASADLDNVGGYSALKLPVSKLADKKTRDEFFAVLLWIKDSIEKGE